jgi:hypothetical protein
MRGRYSGGVAAEIENAAEERAESRDAADDHADAVFGIAPDENVGDAD